MLEPTDSGVQDRWRALWASSPQRSPFSRLEYVRALGDATGLRVGVHFSEGAGAAVTWRRRGPFREVVLPPLTPFSALLLEAHPRDSDVHARTSALETILELLEREYDGVHLHLPPSIPDVRAAQWRGWTATPLYTYCATESGPDGWSAGTARTYRAGRDDYELVEGTEAAGAAARFVAASYGRRDRALPLDERSIPALVERLKEAGLATSFAVRFKASSQMHAGIVLLRAETDSNAYYWIAGSRPGSGMTVLIGEVLAHLFRSGVETFDFVGANTPSIAEFKRRFAGRLVPYFRLIRYDRRELKILHIFRKMLR